MILPPFRYLRPRTAAEAATMLAEVHGSAVLAGGQTLINALKLDLVQPTALVDIHRLNELRGVRREDGGLWIGAATTYAELARDPVLAGLVPSIPEMAAGLVDRQVRNRGTLGGNCSLNDPTNNFPPLLAALDARFEVITAGGQSTMNAEQFFLGSLFTAVTGGGLLTGIRVSPLPEGSVLVHRHLQLAADSWALARAVVRLDVTDGVVSGAAVLLGAVPGSPYRVAGAQAAVVAKRPGRELADAALAAFDVDDLETIPDTHGSARYRRAMARVQLRRALYDACEELTG